MSVDMSRWPNLMEQPDWYLTVGPEYREIVKAYQANPTVTEPLKQARQLVVDLLAKDKIALGSTGMNLDEQRQPIDTLVIHHTSAPAGTYTPQYMNGVHLMNLYVPNYLNPQQAEERAIKSMPIWSNHFDQAGRQVFYGYHWIMTMDGRFERLLEDSAIGWQAGNWKVNCRSIGICLDNDYENVNPDAKIIENLARFIHQTYPKVDLANIVGHHEVSRIDTLCPGNGWAQRDGWKSQLLRQLRECKR